MSSPGGNDNFLIFLPYRESRRSPYPALPRDRSKLLRLHPWRLGSGPLRLLQRWGLTQHSRLTSKHCFSLSTQVSRLSTVFNSALKSHVSVLFFGSHHCLFTELINLEERRRIK
jgi:hypothetical protein